MSMASTISSPLVQTLSLRSERNAHPPSCKANGLKSAPTSCTSRRQLLFLLTAAPALTARESASIAEDIPLFGLRKKLKKAEEEAEELVREGFETAEKGIERAEEGIETAERAVEGAVSLEGVAQAGAVGGAELVGVIVATSLVNGILGPEKS